MLAILNLQQYSIVNCILLAATPALKWIIHYRINASWEEEDECKLKASLEATSYF